jgi:hypothetical protein
MGWGSYDNLLMLFELVEWLLVSFWEILEINLNVLLIYVVPCFCILTRVINKNMWNYMHNEKFM